MKEGPDISFIAALIGDPARANMLTALLSGKALTVSELAAEAGVTLQTASAHLKKLNEGGLLRPRKQGRHKYFSLANDEVAAVLEGLMGLAFGAGHLRMRTGPKDDQLRHARVCYNHLAGRMGAAFFESLRRRDYIRPESEDMVLTDAGRAFIEEFGIDLTTLTKGKAPLCKECLDWSERRSHLAGSLGRAVLTRIEELNWATRDPKTRIIAFTKHGQAQFDLLLGSK
ncbi:MAG: ArsR/SmtB family transcription factor [Halocynthiibacter sp.]